MDSKNKKDEDSILEMADIVKDMAVLLGNGEVLHPVLIVIALFILIFKAVEWLINLFLPKNKQLPKIKSIKPETMEFHIGSKKKIITVLSIDVLLSLGLVCAWRFGIIPPITETTLCLLLGAIFIVSLLLIVSCDMHATIGADNKNIYINYDYLFYKRKVKEIHIARIKKIKIMDNKIRLTTKFKRYLLTVEPDSDAYAYLLRLKRDLNI